MADDTDGDCPLIDNNVIHYHKLEWIKKADRDSYDDNRPIITAIEVEPLGEQQ